MVHSRVDAPRASCPEFNAEREADIAKAIKYYNEILGVNKSKAAATFLVSYNFFKKRLKGWPVQNTKGGNNKALNCDQEHALRQYLDFLINCGHQGIKIYIKLAANSIFRAAGSTRQLDL
jgi:hypothetical protein